MNKPRKIHYEVSVFIYFCTRENRELWETLNTQGNTKRFHACSDRLTRSKVLSTIKSAHKYAEKCGATKYKILEMTPPELRGGGCEWGQKVVYES